MTEQLANRASSTLNGAIDNVVTSLTVANGTVFPASGTFRIVIDNEIIIVGARSANVLSSLTRGAEGTTAAAHANGAAVDHYLTKGGLDAYIKDATHLATGTPDGTKFIRDDMALADLNVLLGIRVLTGSGTYTPTAGTKRVRIVCIGGGGGSGGVGASSSGLLSIGGAGGGGAYAESLLTTGFSGASYSCGAAGTAGTSGGGNGGNGGDTSFGTGPLVMAKGGLGGLGATNGVYRAGGAGGDPSASVGAIKIGGQQGQLIGNPNGQGTIGGGAGGGMSPDVQGVFIGGGGNTQFTGVAGQQYGGGAAGAISTSVGGAAVGSAGAAGAILVYEYA